MKWKCTVCGYVHDGETPPDHCPRCGSPSEKFERVGLMGMARYVCTLCGYVYDPRKGEPPIPAGTAFEDLPGDWVCPLCGAGKDAFEKEQE